MGFGLDSIRRGISNVVDAGRNAVENVVEAGRDVVENVVQTGQNVVEQGRDVFEGAVDKAQDIAGGITDFVRGRTDDKKNDGAILYPDGTSAPAGSTIERDPSKPLVLQVNGISTDLQGQVSALEAVQEATGGEAQVVGIHNATEGMLRDLGQAALDTLGKGHNPAVDSLADQIVAELEAGRPVHVMAHSQGGLITSRALEQVKQQLMMEGGMTAEQATSAMNNIQVESFGSAAPSWPDGPQYVHYVNLLDPVPMGLGLAPGFGNPGEGAVVRHFSESSDFHSFNSTYMDNRVPFDQARNNDFSNPGTDGL